MPNYGDLRTNKTPAETYQALLVTFRKWGVTEHTVNWDQDGRGRRVWPRGGFASITFVLAGKEHRLTCDRFYEYANNLRALWSTCEGLRLASQRGILEQYRQFFEALPPPSGAPIGMGDESPYAVLELAESASIEAAEAAYRAKARIYHPDNGGSQEAMAAINVAIAAIRKEKGG